MKVGHVGKSAGNVLAIETSHSQGSVALGSLDPVSLHPGDSIRTEMFPPGLVHGREILLAIDRLFESAPIEREDIDHVAVSVGPGSYTGIRIGVAAAKALAFALSADVAGVSTLEAVAANVPRDALADGCEFAVLLDARRGACYGARFRCDDDGLTRVTNDAVIPVDEFLAGLPSNLPLLGEGAATLPGAERFPHWTRHGTFPSRAAY